MLVLNDIISITLIDPTTFNELIQQYKSNVTNLQSEFKKYLEVFVEDDNPTTTSPSTTTTTTDTTTTANSDDDNNSESPTTQRQEEYVRIKMILSNLTESDLNNLEIIQKAIKNVIIKIYKAVDITITESSITINKIDDKKRYLDSGNAVTFEITIKAPNDVRLDTMNTVIESKTTEFIKNELITENSEIFQYVGLEIDFHFDDKSNAVILNLFLLIITLLLPIM